MQLSQGSIHRYKTDLNHFLIWLDDTLVETCNAKYPSFSTYLQKSRIDGQSKSLAPATQKKAIQTAKQFLHWAKMNYPQRFKNLPGLWIDSMQPGPHVTGQKEHEFVSLEEVVKLATGSLPIETLVNQRDQAAAAMLFLSGMRASSFVSLPIKAVDISRKEIKQWPSLGVRTKFRKHSTTYLLDIPVLLEIVAIWDNFIRAQLPGDAMWYPVIISEWSSENISSKPPGKNRHIQLGKRLRKLSNLVGMEYKSPHKYRHGHAVYALLQAKNMADYKAISQNLMHGSIQVTDSIYAWLNDSQVKDRIASLSHTASERQEPQNEMEAYISKLTKTELKQALQQVTYLLTN